MLVNSLVFFVCGSFGWTFAEYALHNWYGHKAKGKNEFSREHLAHHANTEYFAANWKKALATIKVAPFIFLLMAYLSGFIYSSIFMIGFLLTYASYEIIHRRIHTHAPKNAYASFIRKHHAYHHFSNPRYNHGVTVPIWDFVFGTFRKAEVIRIPEANIMKWLLDETGSIKPEYSKDYELIVKKNLNKEEVLTA